MNKVAADLAKTLAHTYSDISNLLNSKSTLSLDKRNQLKRTLDRITTALEAYGDAVK